MDQGCVLDHTWFNALNFTLSVWPVEMDVKPILVAVDLPLTMVSDFPLSKVPAIHHRLSHLSL